MGQTYSSLTGDAGMTVSFSWAEFSKLDLQFQIGLETHTHKHTEHTQNQLIINNNGHHSDISTGTTFQKSDRSAAQELTSWGWTVDYNG